PHLTAHPHALPPTPTRRSSDLRAENGVTAAILGVGFNVAIRPADLPADEPDLRQRVTSLAMLGLDVDRLLVLGELTSALDRVLEDRKSTRLNSSHVKISYAVLC